MSLVQEAASLEPSVNRDAVRALTPAAQDLVVFPEAFARDFGSAGSDVVPMDQVSLNYAKIEVKYKEQKADGSLGGEVIGGWDVTTNKKV